MSQNAVESFLGRIITDKKFRKRAMAALEPACSGAGLVVSREEMACLKSLNFAHFEQLAESVDGAIRRS